MLNYPDGQEHSVSQTLVTTEPVQTNSVAHADTCRVTPCGCLPEAKQSVSLNVKLPRRKNRIGCLYHSKALANFMTYLCGQVKTDGTAHRVKLTCL